MPRPQLQIGVVGVCVFIAMLPPIKVVIESVINSGVESNIKRVTGAVEGVGQASTNAAQSANKLDEALDNAGDNDGLQAVERAADDAGQSIEGVGASAEQLKGKLENVRNAGLALTAIGVGGLAISQSFIEAYKEGDGLETKLESILKAQDRLGDLDAINKTVGDVAAEGHFDDDDSIRDAAIHMASFGIETQAVNDLLSRVARQARTMGTDVVSVADGMGKAYNAISLGPLARSGLAFSQAEVAALEYAKSLGEVEGRAKFVEIVTAAVDRNTVSLGDSLTGAEAASNDLARAWDDATTQMGAGAAEAQASVYGVLGSVLDLANASPELEHAAGYLGYFVSGGAAAVGGLLSVGSQIGLTIVSLQSMGITSVASFGVMAKAAWASFAAMAKGALTAAPAIWSAMAPLLPLILAIAAAALVTVGALYLLSGAQAAQEQAAADDEQANAKDKEFYEQQVARQKEGKTSHVNQGESYEQWQKRMQRGEESSEISGTKDPTAAITGLSQQISGIKSGSLVAPPSGGATMSPVAPTLPVETGTSTIVPISNIPAGGAPVVLAPNAVRGAVAVPSGGAMRANDSVREMTDSAKIARVAMFAAGGGRGDVPDFSDGGRRSFQVPLTAESYRQNANGDIDITVSGVLTVPNQGIGALRGRTRGRG